MSLLNSSHSELIDAVKNDNLVIFAGAGISKGVGLPLWGELLRGIINHIGNNDTYHKNTLEAIFNNRSAKNSFFDVLSFIERNKLQDYVNHVLKKEIHEKVKGLVANNTVFPLHSKLWQVSRKIITPNYDTLFESCLEFKNGNIEMVTNKSILGLSEISSNPEYLLKIHGNISEIEDIVFYESQYEKQYKDETAVTNKLKELISNRPILFVGTSMTDPFMNDILEKVNTIFHGCNAKNFFLSQKEIETADIIKIHGNPIDDLDILLDELLDIKVGTKEPVVVNNSVEEKLLEKPKPRNELNLFPTPKPYFTGRDKELEDFGQAIESGHTFIVVDGAGGIGKTQFIAKCIEKYLDAEKVMWFDCEPSSQFDSLITSAGYPELLEGAEKTNKEKFSALKDKLEEGAFYLFLDNFQETNAKPLFHEFLVFVETYLKKGCVIVIDRDDISSIQLTPKRIHISEFKDDKLEYAKALIEHSYNGIIGITDEDLSNLCNELQGYPLAIEFAIVLLRHGEKHSDIISKIVNAEGGEEISERLLNAIFSRPDATQEERDFMLQFSVFTGGVSQDVVETIIEKKISSSAPKALIRKNLLTFSNGVYEMHSIVRAFCYKKLNDKEDLHKKVADYFIKQRKEELSPTLEERIYYHLAAGNQWTRIQQDIVDRGKEFLLKGQLDLVKEMIEKLVGLGLERPIFNVLIADIEEIRGNWDNALTFYEKAKNQEKETAIKAEGTNGYAEILYKKGEIKDALTIYEEAYMLSKKNYYLREEALSLNGIGSVNEFLGNVKKAFKSYELSLKMNKEIENKEGIATSLGNLGRIYYRQGNYSKAMDYQDGSLQIEEEIGNKEGIAASLGNLGGIYYRQGDYSKALDYHERSLRIKEEIGNKEGIAASMGNLGWIYSSQGDYSKALDYQNRSLRIEEEIGNKQGIAASLGNLGSIYSSQGDYSKAFDYYKHSLKIDEEIGNKEGIAASLGNLGRIYSSQGDYSNALDYQNRSLRIQEEIGNKQGIAASLGNLGSIYSSQGDYSKAFDYYRHSLKIEEEIGNKEGIAASLGNLGRIYSSQGDYSNALDYQERSLRIQEEIGNKEGIAASLGNLGSIYSSQGDYSKALDYQERSLKIEEEIGNKEGIAASLGNLGRIYSSQGDYSNALDYQERSLKIQEEIGNREGIAASLGNLGSIYCSQDDYSKALDYQERSLRIEEDIGNKQGIAASLGNLGSIYSSQGDYPKALDYHERSLRIKEEIGNKEGIAASLGNLGKIYSSQGDYSKALDYQNRSLRIQEEIGNKQGIAASSGNLGITYIKMKESQYDIAMENLLKSLAIFNQIALKMESQNIMGWIVSIRKKIGLNEFRKLVEQSFKKLDASTRENLSLQELLNEPIRTEKKVGRNEPCPCGSGMKYKKCHGK